MYVYRVYTQNVLHKILDISSLQNQESIIDFKRLTTRYALRQSAIEKIVGF